MFNISQTSELSGYSQRMIRYLEEQGLLGPRRTPSNQRIFQDNDISRILKIRRFKELGFSYSEIKELIDASPEIISEKGTELLKRQHEVASELTEKIRRLEVLCFGKEKTNTLQEARTSLLYPKRTAYKIPALDIISKQFSIEIGAEKYEITFWKFKDFIENNLIESNFEVFDVFKQSACMCLFVGDDKLKKYAQNWEHLELQLSPNNMGSFSNVELKEFFGSYDIVIEHKFLAKDGAVLFHALLPYQAVFANQKCAQ